MFYNEGTTMYICPQFVDLLCKAADQAVFLHQNVLGSDLSRFSADKVLCYVVCIAVMELHTN